MVNESVGTALWRGLPRVVLLSILFAANVHAAPPSASPDDSNRMDAIRSLAIESLPGSMPTFYSPHAKARAQYLQGLLGGEIAYISSLSHVPMRTVALAVLDRKQWPLVAGDEPYGMPSVDGTKPPVFVMPASWDGVQWMLVPRREDVPPDMLSRALATGRTWDQVKFEGCDGIGTHEIGHSIIHQLGVDPQTHWLNEFLASYVGYAYLKARDPHMALASEIFWAVGLKNAPHEFTKLEDFETRYDELQQKYPGNYGWYQLALDQRVMEIYARSGADHILQIRRQFPTGAERLNSEQLLNKLEQITPGWKAWAGAVEAGTIRSTP